MFNTLCIVGGSAIACGKLVALDNRIFYRDGCSYAFAILVLALGMVSPVVKRAIQGDFLF